MFVMLGSLITVLRKSHAITMKDNNGITGMTSLALELLQNVAQHCDRDSIRAFRLTSHRMHAAADDSFIEHFFTTRQHVVSRHSLRCLVEITARPYLTRKLQRLDLIAIGPRGSGHSSVCTIPHWYCNGVEREQAEYLRATIWKAWDEEVKGLYYDGDGQMPEAERLLEFALLNLAKHSIYPFLMASNTADGSDQSLMFGEGQLQDLCKESGERDIRKGPRLDSGNLVNTLLRAICKTSFPVTRLQLEPLKDEQFECSAFDLPQTISAKLDNAMMSLTVLHIDTGAHHGIWCTDHKQGLGLVKFLAAAINIEEVTLSGHACKRRDDKNMLKRFSDAFASHKKIRRLELRHFRASAAQFIAFLEHHKASLTDLSICNFDWTKLSKSRWSDILRFILGNLELERLDVTMDAQRDLGAREMMSLGGRQGTNWKGVNSVKSNIRKWFAINEYEVED